MAKSGHPLKKGSTGSKKYPTHIGPNVWGWVDPLGLCPKEATKQGVGQINYYKTSQGPHFTVKTIGDETLHTEQIVIDEIHNTTHSIASDIPPDKMFQIDVFDIEAAQQLQKQKLGTNTGIYDKYTNSCLTEACKILNKGGTNLPTTTKEAVRYLRTLK